MKLRTAVDKFLRHLVIASGLIYLAYMPGELGAWAIRQVWPDVPLLVPTIFRCLVVLPIATWTWLGGPFYTRCQSCQKSSPVMFSP